MDRENQDAVSHVPAEKAAAVADALLDFEIDPNFKRWPVLEPEAHYKRDKLDIRQELVVDPDLDLPDYSGPFKSDLRFTDFSSRAARADAGDVRRVPSGVGGRLAGRGRADISDGGNASPSNGSPGVTCWRRVWKRCCASSFRRPWSTSALPPPISAAS